MTKSQIRNFLLLQKERAIQRVKDEYNPLIDAEIEKTIEPYKSDLDELDKTLEKARDLMLKIDNAVRLDDNVSFSRYWNLRNRFNAIIDCSAHKFFKDSIDCTNDVQKLINKRDKLIDDIESEYEKLDVMIKNTSSIKQIVEQLELFGFDLTRLKIKPTTALTVIDANKDLLFYPNKKALNGTANTKKEQTKIKN